MKLSQNEINEYRRIVYNQKIRELTQQEQERLSFFKTTYTLEPRDQMGYDFEIKEILPKLIEAGLSEYLKHNPIDPFEWSHTKTIGVDFELKICDYELYIEASYCKKPYHYRNKWFTKCRIPRFENCPKPSEFVYWIVLTNRPENFNSVKDLANEYSITIMSIDNILSLITNLTTNNKLTN